MRYVKVRPLHEWPWIATVWSDEGGGHLTTGARYLGSLKLRGSDRHYVTPRGEEQPTHWYSQLTAALQHLLTGTPGETSRKVVIARPESIAPVGGIEHGSAPSPQAAIRDWRAMRAAYGQNNEGRDATQPS